MTNRFTEAKEMYLQGGCLTYLAKPVILEALDIAAAQERKRMTLPCPPMSEDDTEEASTIPVPLPLDWMIQEPDRKWWRFWR